MKKSKKANPKNKLSIKIDYTGSDKVIKRLLRNIETLVKDINDSKPVKPTKTKKVKKKVKEIKNIADLVSVSDVKTLDELIITCMAYSHIIMKAKVVIYKDLYRIMKNANKNYSEEYGSSSLDGIAHLIQMNKIIEVEHKKYKLDDKVLERFKKKNKKYLS